MKKDTDRLGLALQVLCADIREFVELRESMAEVLNDTAVSAAVSLEDMNALLLEQSRRLMLRITLTLNEIGLPYEARAIARAMEFLSMDREWHMRLSPNDLRDFGFPPALDMIKSLKR